MIIKISIKIKFLRKIKMVKNSDLKSFGLIWAGIFMFIGLIPLIKHGDIRIWAIVVSFIFIALSILKPELLTQFYKIWMKIGNFIGNIISKVMISVLFFLIFTPIAIILRLAGKDLLNKKISKSQKSYWIEREVQPESMKNQF